MSIMSTAHEIQLAHPLALKSDPQTIIAKRYREQFGANMQHFLPHIKACRSDQGEIDYTFGFGGADESSLFLECYLDAPIERVISNKLNQPISRQSIVEVGNLVVNNRRHITKALLCIHQTLSDHGYQYVVCTTTKMLRAVIRHLKLDMQTLCAADKSVLSLCEQENWGQYYDHQPKIIVGNIQYNLKLLINAT